MLKVTNIHKLAFDDTVVSVEGDGIHGDLHFAKEIELALGETIDTKSFLGGILDSMKNLLGMSKEQALAKAEARVGELEGLLSTERTNLSVAQAEANAKIIDVETRLATASSELAAANSRINELTEQLAANNAGQ